jgi:hypothetical protein
MENRKSQKKIVVLLLHISCIQVKYRLNTKASSPEPVIESRQKKHQLPHPIKIIYDVINLFDLYVDKIDNL